MKHIYKKEIKQINIFLDFFMQEGSKQNVIKQELNQGVWKLTLDKLTLVGERISPKLAFLLTGVVDTQTTGPIGTHSQLKQMLINMVQASQFYTKAHDQCSSPTIPRDLQHFHFQGHPQRCYITSPFPILTLGESEAVVLRQQGEEYYVGTMFH